MNNSIIAVLLLSACGLSAVVPVNPSELIATKPELDKLLKAYNAIEEGFDAEIALQLKDAITRHVTAMAEIEKKNTVFYKANVNPTTADRAKDSIRLSAMWHGVMVRAHGIDSALDKNAPMEIQAAWAKVLQVSSNAERAIVPKRTLARQELIGALTALDRSYIAQKDVVGHELAGRIKACVAIRKAIELNYIDFTVLKSRIPYESSWKDLVREGGYLVGFEWAKVPRKTTIHANGRFELDIVNVALTPVFATAGEVRNGSVRGHKLADAPSERVIAKDGYAVGGVTIRRGPLNSYVSAVKIVFSRIKPDGLSLDVKDSYTTDWLGGELPALPPAIKPATVAPVEASSRGKLIVGLHGNVYPDIETLGLIYLK
jgi:hypothetical protein